MNNFEKIKSMNIKEMKNFLGSLWADILANANKKGCCIGELFMNLEECPISTGKSREGCMYCYEKWLLQEVENDR